MHHSVLRVRSTAMDTVMDRMAGGISVRFRPERRIAERRHEMRMNMQRRMRCDHDTLLLRIVRDAQRFGEAGGASRVELHEADRAGVDEVANRVAMPFAFAMRQRDR